MWLALDLETTGLNPHSASIIEVYARAENGEDLNLIVRPTTFFTSGAAAMHDVSGLRKMAEKEGITVEDADGRLRAFIDAHVPGGEEVHLLGNSVHFDYGFICHHMPLTAARLSHRLLDVTAVRLCLWWATGVDPLMWTKNKCHRAKEDVDETIRELNFYAERFKCGTTSSPR